MSLPEFRRAIFSKACLRLLPSASNPCIVDLPVFTPKRFLPGGSHLAAFFFKKTNQILLRSLELEEYNGWVRGLVHSCSSTRPSLPTHSSVLCHASSGKSERLFNDCVPARYQWLQPGILPETRQGVGNAPKKCEEVLFYCFPQVWLRPANTLAARVPWTTAPEAGADK